MSVRLGADATSTSVSELKALGATFVCRYVSPNSVGSWKNLTLAEANALKSAGFDIVTNWELDTNDCAGGFNQGVNYAKQAEAMHLACGGPAAAPIYFSVDEDVAANTADSYFQGIVSVLGVARVGVYAETSMCTHLKSSGLVTYTWRTMSTDWPGGFGAESDFNIEQTGFFNNDYDRDASITVDFGQWSAHGGAVSTPILSNPVAAAGNYQQHASENTHLPLVVDGYFGTQSWKALQAVLFGSTSSEVDGVPGPVTITALQEMLNAYHGALLAHDGVMTPGYNTIKSVQEKAGATQDGYWGPATSKAVQAALNAKTFWGSN